MAINNVSVQYNGGLLPDIILLTRCYYEEVLYFKLTGLPKKWERILKWERTATVLNIFKSALVDFEGTFGGVSIQLLAPPICSNSGVSLLA